MKNGQCPKCSSMSVYKKHNGIVRVVTNPPSGVYIEGLSKIIFPTDIDVHICTDCGYFEEYVTDKTKLILITEKWEKTN